MQSPTDVRFKDYSNESFERKICMMLELMTVILLWQPFCFS